MAPSLESSPFLFPTCLSSSPFRESKLLYQLPFPESWLCPFQSFTWPPPQPWPISLGPSPVSSCLLSTLHSTPPLSLTLASAPVIISQAQTSTFRGPRERGLCHCCPFRPHVPSSKLVFTHKYLPWDLVRAQLSPQATPPTVSALGQMGCSWPPVQGLLS